MASIDKLPNGRYRARWRADRRDHSRTFDRKLDAENFLTTVRADLLTGRYVDPRAGVELVKDYAERWAAQQPWRHTTRARIESTLKRHVYPRFGHRQVKAVTRTEVQAWVAELGRTCKPATVGTYYRVLVAVMSAAVEDRLISETPCRKIKLPRETATNSALVPLTVAQVQALTDAIQPRYRALVVLSAGCGLRQGEACGLTTDRVDFLRRTVRIDRQLVTPEGADTRARFGPTKTPASNRVIELPDVVGRALARHLEDHEPGESGLFFTTAAREPIKRTLWAREFKKAAELAGLDATSHDLRHHCASLLIASGCSVTSVQTYLGHKNASETLNVYSHLWPTDSERRRTAIDTAWDTSQDTSRTQVVQKR